jgi:maltose O-acetyltransferase
VTVSTNVTILAHDASTNVVGAGTKLGRVTIGNNVFIGTGTIILCNTHIGNNVVVGAGSIVTRDLPDDGVYAGSPARRVCSIEEYREKMHNLRNERPDLSQIRPWNQWADASEEDRQKMCDALVDGVGFI